MLVGFDVEHVGYAFFYGGGGGVVGVDFREEVVGEHHLRELAVGVGCGRGGVVPQRGVCLVVAQACHYREASGHAAYECRGWREGERAVDVVGGYALVFGVELVEQEHFLVGAEHVGFLVVFYYYGEQAGIGEVVEGCYYVAGE